MLQGSLVKIYTPFPVYAVLTTGILLKKIHPGSSSKWWMVLEKDGSITSHHENKMEILSESWRLS